MIFGILRIVLGSSILGGSGTRDPPLFTPVGLSDQSDHVGLGQVPWAFVAFGDFNRDRFVDALVVDPSKMNRVLVAIWDHDLYRFVLREGTDAGIGLSTGVTSLAVADFDNDGDVDVLLTTENSQGARIWYSNRDGTFVPGPVLEDVASGFLIMDGNGDLAPDVFAIRSSGERGFYRNTPPARNQSLTWLPWRAGNDLCQVSIPVSTGFVDLNGDCLPDLIVPTSCGLEVWYNPGEEKDFWDLRSTDSEYYRLVDVFLDGTNGDGVIAFVDINGDGTNDLVIPNSGSENVRVYLNLQTQRKYAMLCEPDPEWKLESVIAVSNVRFSEQQLGSSWKIPVSLRFGDFNFDGLPDFLALNGDTGKIELFENKGDWGVIPRMPLYFTRFESDAALRAVDDAIAASFFDLDESGRQDIVVVHDRGTRLIWNNYNKHADALFFKGTVRSLSFSAKVPELLTHVLLGPERTLLF